MRLRLAFIALLPALAATSPAQALERLIDSNNDRWVEVSGEGSISAAPDFARVTLGVTTTGQSAGEAMAANAKTANAPRCVAPVTSSMRSPAARWSSTCPRARCSASRG